MADFAKNLSRIRKQRRLTQQQLADMLDVQQRVISRWETGAVKPHFDHVVRLTQVLELSVDELIFGDEDRDPSESFVIRNKRLQELCQRIDELPVEDQKVVCHVMDSIIRKEQMKSIANTSIPGR